MKKLPFEKVNAAALPNLQIILRRLNIQNRAAGDEIEMLNPNRPDKQFGSFRINARSGRWAEFATGDKGGDPVSLVAFLRGCGQAEACRDLAVMLGVD